MSAVIEFLEKLGADAHLRQATADEIALALADARVEASASEAILAKDAEGLYALLKRAPMYSVQTLPDEEEEEEEERENEDEPSAPDSSARVSVVSTRRVAQPA